MKKINKLVFAFLMLFSFAFSVKAEEYLNEETIKLVVEGINNTSQQNAYIRIYDAGFVEDETYAVTFTKDTALNTK